MSNITLSQDVLAGHKENLKFVEASLPEKGLGVLASSSGTVYCCLTALRDKLYIKKNDYGNFTQAKQPSIATSIIVRTFMEAAYALLAVTSIIELVVRGPLALLGLLALKISNKENTILMNVSAALIFSSAFTLVTLAYSASNLYFNLMNAPIGRSPFVCISNYFDKDKRTDNYWK